MVIFGRRASAILFDLATTLPSDAPFLLPVNVCTIVPQTLAAAGRRFELVDIDPVSLDMDREQTLHRLRNGRYAGVLFVRPYGSMRDVEPFFAAIKNAAPDALLIDDRCLCRPDFDGSTSSPHADVTLYSTGRAKYVDLGGAGFAYVRDVTAATGVRSPGVVENAPEWLELGAPRETWEAQRKRGLLERDRIDEVKRSLNEIYRAEIPPHVQYPPELCEWRFNVRVDDAAALVSSIFAGGLFASRHFAPIAAAFGDVRHYPAAERVHATIVNLFNDRYFDAEKARRTAEIVRTHVTRSLN